MNLIKRLAVAGTTGAFLLSSVATPTFAAANAWNKNVTNHSWAKAKAEDNDVYVVNTNNFFTETNTFNVTKANTGGNVQLSGKSDGNSIKTGDASAFGKTDVSVNTTIINF